MKSQITKKTGTIDLKLLCFVLCLKKIIAKSVPPAPPIDESKSKVFSGSLSFTLLKRLINLS